MSYIKSLSEAKREYTKIKDALGQVNQTGYGVVMPLSAEIKLDSPQMTKSGGRSGIRLKASAPSLHIIKVDVHAQVSPIVGTTPQQSEEVAKFLMTEYDKDPNSLWETKIFGKSLLDMVQDSLNGKVIAMKPETQVKMRRTVNRIVNEGRGGVICILL